jgi:hypothetical protein
MHRYCLSVFSEYFLIAKIKFIDVLSESKVAINLFEY